MLPRCAVACVFAALACATCNRARGVTSANEAPFDPSRELHIDPSGPSRESRAEAAVCAGRPDCHLEVVVDGGKSHQGPDLVVAMVHMPSERGGIPCTLHDVWLASVSGQDVRAEHRIWQRCLWKVKPTIRPLATGSVSLSLGKDDHTADCDDHARSDPAERLEVTLDPLRVARSFGSDAFWDFEDFEGATCQDGTATEKCEDPALDLPSVEVSVPFASDGWRGTGLGQCAMRFGPVRALLSGGALYLEVDIDPTAPVGALQINLAPFQAFPDEMESWTLGMEGKLTFERGGKRWPTSAHAEEVAPSPLLRRFKVTGIWRQEIMFVSMIYGPYKSYHSQRPYPQSVMREISRDQAVCMPREGALEVVHTPPDPDPTKPLPLPRLW